MFERKLRNALQEGCGLRELSRAVDISPQTAVRYLAALGLEIPPTRREHEVFKRGRVPSDTVLRMIGMRKEGATLEQIGKACGCTREWVRQCLARHCPDVVFPVPSSHSRVCEWCGSMFVSKLPRTFCTTACRTMKRYTDKSWTRDTAVRIMNMRSQGMTWDAVAAGLGYPPAKAKSFRSALQRFTPLLFSSAERQHYFPPRTNSQSTPQND